MVSTEKRNAAVLTEVEGYSRTCLWSSIAAAILAIAGNVVSLIEPSIYSDLTTAFLPQALAQDLANLALVSPAMLILAVLSFRGSLRAYLLWLGVVTFTVYNYVIYSFSVPFGPLFLLWVSVLGLSFYSLIGGIAAANHRSIQTRFALRTRVRVAAWVLIVVAVFFAVIWLSEDIPASFRGSTPASVVDMGLPTNPVHILDLAFFLPAVIVTAVMLLKQLPLGYTLAPAFIVFLLFTGVPILLTPFVQSAIGQTPAWGVALPIGTLTLVLLAFLVWLVASIHSRKQD